MREAGVLDAGCSMLDARCWILDARCWMLDARCGTWDAGALLAVGARRLRQRETRSDCNYLHKPSGCEMREARYAMRWAICILLLLIIGCGQTDQPDSVIDAVTIEMTGHDFKWHSRYPGEDGQWGTTDDVEAAQVLHVPVKANVEIVLKSLDYVYSLEVPQAGLKEIAVPDMTFTIRFETEKVGRFRLPGDQLCGYSHPDLIGTLIVETQKDYRRWLDAQQ